MAVIRKCDLCGKECNYDYYTKLLLSEQTPAITKEFGKKSRPTKIYELCEDCRKEVTDLFNRLKKNRSDENVF